MFEYNHTKYIQKTFGTGLDGQFVLAAFNGDEAQTDALLKEGANINCVKVDYRKASVTPLSIAVEVENKRAVTLLLKRGADPNIVDSYDGNTALTVAASMPYDPWFLEQLLQRGANPNGLDNPAGLRLPLAEAVYAYVDNHQTKNIDILLAAGANINGQDGDGETALKRAANLNQFDLVYTLLQKGADPTIQINTGFTINYNLDHNVISDDAKPDLEKVRDWLKQRGLYHPETKEEAWARSKLYGSKSSDKNTTTGAPASK